MTCWSRPKTTCMLVCSYCILRCSASKQTFMYQPLVWFTLYLLTQSISRNTLKHFIFKRHFLMPASDRILRHCIRFNSWFLALYKLICLLTYLNMPCWSHKFHPHLCRNWCLQIFVLSTYTSRLEHSVCWSPSQVLVVCKRVSWSGRLSHDTPAVKGDANCWIFTEEMKNLHGNVRH